MTKRLLSTQRIVNLASNPASGTAGEVYYNTTSNELRVYNGTTWIAIGSGGGGGASITVSDTPPVSPTAGALWFNSSNLKTYIYYDSAWVEVGATTGQASVQTDTYLSNSWWLGV